MATKLSASDRLQKNYQITVEGRIDASWSEWFRGLKISTGRDERGMAVTILNGEIEDQAMLRGLLNRLWDLNMTVCSISQIDLNFQKEDIKEVAK